jgi:4-alpha-glucanotransferase
VPSELRRAEQRFLDDPETRGWLDDWASYAAIKDEFRGKAWNSWPVELRNREPGAMADARDRLAESIRFHTFVQFLVHRQWARLRAHARGLGVRILGDLPIYVALDSADVWSGREWFRLDGNGRPTHVAGVPPDYFSRTGQRWGNPLYRWDRMQEDGYSWWITRARAALRGADAVRLDHFRGFEAYWEIPAAERTAVAGHWVQGPGRSLFDALRDSLGSLPFLAEDLGVITDSVRALRDDLGLPGMKVLQFGFGEDSEHHPDRIGPRDVVYTGTHDNNTTLGWWRSLRAAERETVRSALRGERTRMPDDLVAAALSSVGELAVVPMQDWLGLGSEARFNRPGKRSRNWVWRMPSDSWTDARIARMRRETRAADRIAGARS